MRIQIAGDDSISHQARIYAEYRLFAALSQSLDTRHVRHASLALSRTKDIRQSDGVMCLVTIELYDGEVGRFRTYGDHPYAAVNRAMERVRMGTWLARDRRSSPPAAAGS